MSHSDTYPFSAQASAPPVPDPSSWYRPFQKHSAAHDFWPKFRLLVSRGLTSVPDISEFVPRAGRPDDLNGRFCDRRLLGVKPDSPQSAQKVAVPTTFRAEWRIRGLARGIVAGVGASNAWTGNHRSCEPMYAAMFIGVPDKLIFQGIESTAQLYLQACILETFSTGVARCKTFSRLNQSPRTGLHAHWRTITSGWLVTRK